MIRRAVAAALAAGVEEYDEEKLRFNLDKASQLGMVMTSPCACCWFQYHTVYTANLIIVYTGGCMLTGVQDNVDRAWEMLNALITEKQYLYDCAAYQLQVMCTLQ